MSHRHTPTYPPTRRGVAMLIVITILVTMVLVALPFALSMRQGQERTLAVGARDRARFEAETLADIAKLFLARSHPFQEQQRYDRGERGVDAQPTVDNLDEITPNDAFRKQIESELVEVWEKDPAMAARAQYLRSRGLGPLNDDGGSIWTVLIQDAQALVNVNGASPFLLGNLMGAALLSDDLDTGGGDISVENVVTGRFGGLRGFAPNGGYIRIGREVIRYEEFDGEAFRGCERGALTSTPLGDNGGAEDHKRGTPVIDYAAYKLATHLVARHPGNLTRFENLEALRDIASWGEGGVLTADRLERVLPFLTVWSKRESSAEWLANQLVINEIPASIDGTEPDEIQVRDFVNNPAGTPAYVNPGTIIRVTDGVRTVYQVVEQVGDDAGRRRDFMFTTAGSVAAGSAGDFKMQGGETEIAAYAPHPININTASREVLYAVLANVQLWRAEGKEQVVTPELAWSLAGEIVEARKGALRADKESSARVGGPFRNAEDFSRWLALKVKSSQITRAHHAALYLNAINPHSWMLRFGTAPWCYRTLDVYHVEARVALNNRAGEQIADASVREVVEIGSDTTATWSLDSQDDFEQRIAMGSGAKWTTTYPFSVAFKNQAWDNIQPAIRGPKGFINGVYPSTTRGDDIGDVRLEPARLLLAGAQVVEHFDSSWYADGHFTGYDGAYTRPVKGTLQGSKDQRVRPFSMSFWWRPYSDQDWTVFDAGVEPFMNRFALFVKQGEQGQELTFSCSAGNLWQQAAEVYVPMTQLAYEPGTWYHIHVSCDGEDPATMQLLVDGVDVGRRRGLTLTTGSITSDNTEISVENTEGFPVRGSIRIGTEIVEYQARSDTTFSDCIRGARGTTPQEFTNGSPVHINGYTMPLTVDVMKGGASLQEELGRWSALRVSTMNGGQPAPDTIPVVIEGATTPVILRGFGPDQTHITLTGVGMWGQDDAEGAKAFATRGIALLGCPEVGNGGGDSGVKLGGWEVVYYERSGNEFTIERYIETKWQGSAEHYFLITENVTGMAEFPCFLVPISVLAQGAVERGADYLDPSDAQQEEILVRYYSGDASGRVALPVDSAGNEGETEIIRYDSIERERASPGILFVRDRSIGGVTQHFFGNAQTIAGGSSNNDPGDTTPPLPTPPDEEPPVPVPDDGGDLPPADDGTPKDPTPGDGVPPGQREPTDPTPTDPGDPSVPGEGDGGTSEPGGTTGPTPSGGSGGTADGEEPAGGDSGGGNVPGSDQPLAGGEESGGSTGPGDSAGPGSRPAEDGGDTGGDVPPEEEPAPDGSGGGGEQLPSGDDASDAKIPDVVRPGAREPTDGEGGDGDGQGDTSPTGQVWEPAGPETARNILQHRGVNSSRDWEHSGGGESSSYFLPCFRAWETFVAAPVARTGRNDVITISDGGDEPTRIEVGLRWGDPTSDWVCLTDFVDKRFEAPKKGANTRRNDPRGYPRILRFPCGELPDDMGRDLEFGQSQVSGAGLVTAFLDELHVWRHSIDTTLVVNNTGGLNQEADEIIIANTGTTQNLTTLDGYDKDCGLVLIAGELIVYRGARLEGDTALILSRCARAQMGTRPMFHPVGDPVRFLPDIPVSYLDGGLTSDASTIPLVKTRGFPSEGLVRILHQDTAEMVHYTRKSETELVMPVSLDPDERTRDRGLLRGRFGTDATEHDSDAIVIWQPFRYWDRYTPRRGADDETFDGVHDHPETAYLEIGMEARSALFRGFSWSENVMGRLSGSSGTMKDEGAGSSSGFMDLYVMARFNKNVPWDTTNVVDLRGGDTMGRAPNLTAMQNTHLFLYDDVGAADIGAGRHGNGLNIEADSAEFRIYYVYKPNAFLPLDTARQGAQAGAQDAILSNYWKQTPWLRAFHVNYFSRTHSLYKAALR